MSFPVGNGLTGWVAQTQQSAVIRDKALEDPRVNYVPELEEEQFQSLVSALKAGQDVGFRVVDSRNPTAGGTYLGGTLP